jgi:hypothetical protein
MRSLLTALIFFFQAYNGPQKGWKTKPVNKSPLCASILAFSQILAEYFSRWYNTPYSSSKKNSTSQHDSLLSTSKSSGTNLDGQPTDDEAGNGDSRPLNFDTFMPTHDPSLDAPGVPYPQSQPNQQNYSFQFPEPQSSTVSQDDAFTRAMGAMYWTGYWTAVYHVSPDHISCRILLIVSISIKGRLTRSITHRIAKMKNVMTLLKLKKKQWIVGEMSISLRPSDNAISVIAQQPNSERLYYHIVCAPSTSSPVKYDFISSACNSL